MKRSEIRENIFKLVFCVEFHSSEELTEQVENYFEDMSDMTEEEHAHMVAKFNSIKEHITEIDDKINTESTKGYFI